MPSQVPEPRANVANSRADALHAHILTMNKWCSKCIEILHNKLGEDSVKDRWLDTGQTDTGQKKNDFLDLTHPASLVKVRPEF